MSRILEIKESTFIKVSLGMVAVLAALIFKSGQAYNRLDNVELAVDRLTRSVEACLNSCRPSTITKR